MESELARTLAREKAQYGTEFTNMDYDKIKKVYSIWICMDAPTYAADTITEYQIQQKNVVGQYPMDKNRFDLLSVIIIGIGEAISDEPNVLRFLGVLFSNDMQIEEKKRILEDEFHIPMNVKLQEGVRKMCNLSEAIEERGIKRGIERGIERGKIEAVIQLADKLGISITEACNLLDIPVETYEKYYAGCGGRAEEEDSE